MNSLLIFFCINSRILVWGFEKLLKDLVESISTVFLSGIRWIALKKFFERDSNKIYSICKIGFLLKLSMLINISFNGLWLYPISAEVKSEKKYRRGLSLDDNVPKSKYSVFRELLVKLAENKV